MRIVSLLPSTTEILFAIGAGDDVVGVTFECDYPPEARERRIVSTSALPEGLDSAGIDAFVSAAVHAGEDLYHLDEGALAGLDADLVVTQDLCAVCAVDVSVVDDALAHLGCTAEVLTLDPHTLEEVLDSILVLGDATGHRPEADALVASLRARLDVVAEAVAARPGPAPRVLLLEWTDPPYAPGHWVPEMVTWAGGTPTVGAVGGSPCGSPGRTPWPETRRWWSVRRAGSTSTAPRPSRTSSSAPGCCPTTCRCGPWTPTGPSPGRGHVWSTASRRWRACSPAPRPGVSSGAVLGVPPHHSSSAGDGSGGTRAIGPSITNGRCCVSRVGSQPFLGEVFASVDPDISDIHSWVVPGHSWATKPSRSCRVSTPTGRPSSWTSRASASRSRPTASETPAPAPMVGSGSSMWSSTWSARRASPP